tara:strand:+ start:114 stop:476 length:363 start_codon:yes stop_codon:yes gene_type:complete
MTISTTKLVDDDFKIIVNSNGVGGEFQQKLVDVVSSNNASSEPKVSIANMQYEILGTGNVTVFFKNDTSKKVEISGRGNYGLKPDEIKIQDPIGDVFLNSDDTVTKYNLVIETHKEAGYK